MQNSLPTFFRAADTIHGSALIPVLRSPVQVQGFSIGNFPCVKGDVERISGKTVCRGHSDSQRR
jgi:hypothetical protein